jgi:hypothetical protein
MVLAYTGSEMIVVALPETGEAPEGEVAIDGLSVRILTQQAAPGTPE